MNNDLINAPTVDLANDSQRLVKELVKEKEVQKNEEQL